MITPSIPSHPIAPEPTPVWLVPRAQWVVVTLVGLALIGAFLPGLRFMVANWAVVEEYSYGYFIPLISGFLIWQKSEQLRQIELRGSWSGLLLLGLGLLLGLVGEFSAIRLFGQYGFIVALVGLTVGFIGWQGTRLIAGPLAILLFMIPLPQFALRELSQQLQLVSSQLGVWLIRLFDISVFLEGNVIDLGSYKLQVVDACSGLRYLFPLMVLGFLAAYFFQGAWWKRACIVLSTIPLTIVINSLRIGLIGVTVEHWGPAMAEGLLHDFEGWFMFMVCIALLIAEMTLLARVGSAPQPLRKVFGLEAPAPVASGTPIRYHRFPTPMLVGGLLLMVVSALVLWSPQRAQTVPPRTSYAQFSMHLPGGWVGQPDQLDHDVLATLALDDYLLANFVREGEPPINFYSAYYASQAGGESSHSPRTCMPGGGWKIEQMEDTTLALAGRAGTMTVNRAIIQKGDQRQLVYYWFDQRGRVLTSEFAVKWYIFRDALLRNRSDGALMRLVTPVASTEDMSRADRRLTAFLSTVVPRLREHVPD